MHWCSRMMLQPRWSCEVTLIEWTDGLDLPKLTTLRTRGSDSWTFYYPRHITLESDSHPLWMMFRHAQSHRCVSSRSIQLQEWRHNQRKYSLHPSLTNRHRSSSTLLQVITERLVTLLFVPHIPFITVWESIISVQILTQWPFQSQAKSIIQNRWNSRSSSFSKTIWNRYISHSVVTCIPFCQHRKRFVFSPFTLISVSVLVWIISQMAFVRVCGYNPFRWVSWLLRFCHVLFFDLLLYFIQALCSPFCRESVVHSLWHEAGVMTC